VRDGGREPLPVRRLRFELLPAQPGERIKLGPPVVFCLLPLGCDPAFLLQLVQSRVEGSFANLQHVSGERFQAETDSLAVQGLERQDFQEKQIEGALDEIVRFTHIGFLDEYKGSFSR
jgi:hypothetical protein